MKAFSGEYFHSRKCGDPCTNDVLRAHLRDTVQEGKKQSEVILLVRARKEVSMVTSHSSPRRQLRRDCSCPPPAPCHLYLSVWHSLSHTEKLHGNYQKAPVWGGGVINVSVMLSLINPYSVSSLPMLSFPVGDFTFCVAFGYREFVCFNLAQCSPL